ncbi:MAG: Molybdopterin or thiamine biosynthesis adenylyltransferase [Devosia sp.]|uniref:molybdopterin-synthase adenylyltransferase MoeB n=1 Tax=Devosia sp. TaxID=1871048 RepID=UPI002636E582|nr:molybdopterin-synthase adenylyltransferase MoeB [Devosia sp.]MDB5528740.1 Molybdopterin or thiamine biosynthesis adenylyltransferase [Devosia sp.]
MTFSPDESRRYARHLVLKGMGGGGQQALQKARVLVIGAGGLGSPAIAYMAAAGVGTLGIVDNDSVSLSNLQRQIVHRTDAIGQAKTASAVAFAAALNPHVGMVAHEVRIDGANAQALVDGYDLVLDGSDNLDTRRAVAAACEALSRPLVSGAVGMFDGQLTIFAPHLQRADSSPAPKFTDLYPAEAGDDDLPSCEANGVLGPLTGVIGTLMAMEAIKLITGIGEPLIGRVLVYDSKGARFSEFSF